MSDLRRQFIDGVLKMLEEHPNMGIGLAIARYANQQGMRRAFYATLSFTEQVDLAHEIIGRRAAGERP